MHAGVQGASDPVKVFDRTPNLQGAQIISYRVSPDDKWSVLIGITAGAPERYAERVGSTVGHGGGNAGQAGGQCGVQGTENSTPCGSVPYTENSRMSHSGVPDASSFGTRACGRPLPTMVAPASRQCQCRCREPIHPCETMQPGCLCCARSTFHESMRLALPFENGTCCLYATPCDAAHIRNANL